MSTSKLTDAREESLSRYDLLCPFSEFRFWTREEIKWDVPCDFDAKLYWITTEDGTSLTGWDDLADFFTAHFDEFGTVDFEGEKYQLTEEAYHACHPDNDDWHARAIRLSDYRLVTIVWEQTDDADEAENCCNWENPYDVVEQ